MAMASTYAPGGGAGALAPGMARARAPSGLGFLSKPGLPRPLALARRSPVAAWSGVGGARLRCAASSAPARPVSAPRFIQHKQEAFWFYRFLSIVYDHVINPGHWTEDMRDDALEPADLYSRHLKVVDVGGGTGFTTLGIVKHVDPQNVTLLDQSPHQLEKARQKEALKGVTIMEGDAEDLPFPTDTFDRYVSAGSIEYWPDPQRGIKEAYRVLRLGGTACLIGPVYPTFWLSRFFADMWMLFPKEEEYIEWFTKAGFKDVKLKRIGPKWYRGVRRHGLIMGCSVTGVKRERGDSPLQLGPKAEDVSKPVNPITFLFRFLMGTICAAYYVLAMEGAIPNPPNTRIAVVTGGNKGIGLEVCLQLAGAGITVVLTARNETRGAAAVEKLREAGISSVIFHQLEITDAPSIARLADFLKTRFGKLDILVNNAAIGAAEYVEDPVDSSLNSEEKFSGMDKLQRLEYMFNGVRETYSAAREGLQTNYYSTKHVIEALLPLLQASSDGRIINVSSEFGLLRLINNEELKQELNDVEKLTEERLDEVLAVYLRDFAAGEVEQRGWPMHFSAYKMSKITLNAYSRILASKHPELRVNCAHPGYVKTDMTIQSGPLTPEEGASNLVKVALLPEGGPTGAYFDRGQEAPFV